jgi:hypothetical protein
LSEPDYRKIHDTAMFLELQRKPSWLVGQNPKEIIQVAPGKEIVYDTHPYPGTGKLGFEWVATAPPGKTV